MLFAIIILLILVIFKLNEYKYRPVGDIPNAKTIIDVFKHIAKKYNKHQALKIRITGRTDRKPMPGEALEKGWSIINYGQYYEHCREFANSVRTIDIHGPILIAGYNAPGWFYAHLGSMMAGAIPVGVYPSSRPSACMNIVNNCIPELLVVENAAQLQKFIKPLLSKKSKIKAVISYSNSINKEIEKVLKIPVYTWIEFINIGKIYTSPTKSKPDINLSNPSNIATIIYTSGTTSNVPKGVMISHGNIVSVAKMMLTRFKCGQLNIEYCKENLVSYLPLNHIAAQMMDIYIPICIAATVWIADKDALKTTLDRTLRQAKPTIFAAVPIVWEKIMEKIETKKNKLPAVARILLNVSSSILDISGSIVIKRMGLENCKYYITTGAPLSSETFKYFNNIGIPIYNIYGMTETTGPISMETSCCNKHGSVGKPLDGINLKIVNKEIIVNGPSIFKGYYRDYNTTKSMFDDYGWFHTGDMGYIDKNGYLYITGRKKDLIITAGGENVAPLPIEENIKNMIPLVEHAIVVGDRKKYLAALLTLKIEITPDGEPTILFTDYAYGILKKIRSRSRNVIDAQDDNRIKTYIDNNIRKINKYAPSNVHTIKKWIIIPKNFSDKGGELTPTMKIRRKFIVKKYKNYIDKLYR